MTATRHWGILQLLQNTAVPDRFAALPQSIDIIDLFINYLFACCNLPQMHIRLSLSFQSDFKTKIPII